jgi:hypothetical protein
MEEAVVGARAVVAEPAAPPGPFEEISSSVIFNVSAQAGLKSKHASQASSAIFNRRDSLRVLARNALSSDEERETKENRKKSLRKKRIDQDRKLKQEIAENLKSGTVIHHNIILMRVIVFIILALVCALGGYYVYTLLSENEEALFNQSFDDDAENTNLTLPHEYYRVFAAAESAIQYQSGIECKF